MSAQKKRRVLVYYIGGITYGEIATIRQLNKILKDWKLEFIIATTEIISGQKCINQLGGNFNPKKLVIDS
jgi:vacuolar protein sorting-associated protein 33A